MSTKREHKGNSLIAFPDEFIVVDIETTGLMSYDDIIEVAAVRYKDGAKVDQFQTLVKPHDDYVDSDECGNPSKEYVGAHFQRYKSDYQNKTILDKDIR